MLKRCFVFQSLQERKQRKALAEAAALFQLIQIDLKTICKFSDRYGNSTCTKVVTFLDQTADFFSSE